MTTTTNPIISRTLTDGRTLTIHVLIRDDEISREVYIDGRWQVESSLWELPNPIAKDGRTYTHRIGKVAITSEEHDAILAAERALGKEDEDAVDPDDYAALCRSMDERIAAEEEREQWDARRRRIENDGLPGRQI